MQGFARGAGVAGEVAGGRDGDLHPGSVLVQHHAAVGVEQRISYAEPVVWIVLNGRGKVVYGRSNIELSFKPGDTVLLPADLADGRVVLDDDTAWLEITIPTASDLAGYARPSREALQAPDPSSPAPIQLNIERPPK